jgi:hypothetical protein
MPAKIRFRRGTAAEWASANPILEDGELGFIKDNNSFKIGDGVTAWNDLTQTFGNTYASQTDLTDALSSLEVPDMWPEYPGETIFPMTPGYPNPAAIMPTTVWYSAFYLPKTVTIDALVVNVTTAVASTSVRAAILERLANGLPGALRHAYVSADSSTTGKKTMILSQPITLDAGVHYFGVGINGSGANVGISGVLASVPYLPMDYPIAGGHAAITITGGNGTPLPTPWSTRLGASVAGKIVNNTQPWLGLRIPA